MNQLRKLMELVDKNVDVIPEGDYIEMCNSMKALHDLVDKKPLRYEPSLFSEYLVEPPPYVPMDSDAYPPYVSEDFYSQPYSIDENEATMESLMDEGHSSMRAAELLIQHIMFDEGSLPDEAADTLIQRWNEEQHRAVIRLAASNMMNTERRTSGSL